MHSLNILHMSKCVNFVNSYFKEVNQKEFHCSVLKSSRDQLQEYAIKNGDFHLKNLS